MRSAWGCGSCEVACLSSPASVGSLTSVRLRACRRGSGLARCQRRVEEIGDRPGELDVDVRALWNRLAGGGVLADDGRGVRVAIGWLGQEMQAGRRHDRVYVMLVLAKESRDED